MFKTSNMLMIALVFSSIEATSHTPCSSLIGYGILGRSVESAPILKCYSPETSPSNSPGTSPAQSSGLLSSHSEINETSKLQISHTISADLSVDEANDDPLAVSSERDQDPFDTEKVLPPGLVAYAPTSSTAGSDTHRSSISTTSTDSFRTFNSLEFLKQHQYDLSKLSKRMYDLSNIQRAIESLSRKISTFPSSRLSIPQLSYMQRKIKQPFKIICGKFLDLYQLAERWKISVSSEDREFITSEITKLRSWGNAETSDAMSPECILLLYHSSRNKKIALRFSDFDPAYLERIKVKYLEANATTSTKCISQEQYIQQLRQFPTMDEDVVVSYLVPQAIKMPAGYFKSRAGALMFAQRSENTLKQTGVKDDFIEKLDADYSEFYLHFSRLRQDWRRFVAQVEQSRLTAYGAAGASHVSMTQFSSIPFSPPLTRTMD